MNQIKSDSALSGECGCVIRIRKDKNQSNVNKNITKNIINQANDTNQSQNNEKLVLKNFFVNNNNNNNRNSDKNVEDEKRKSLKEITIDKVKSACILIKFKPKPETKKAIYQNGSVLRPKQECYSISLENLLVKRLASEEDLNDYGEYNQGSLVDIRKELNDLNNLKLNSTIRSIDA